MAGQLLPIIKAVAPYLAQIAGTAIPAFTPKPAEIAKENPVIARQIEELQTAATQNAESVRVLAENLQQAIQGIEMAAQEANRQTANLRTMLLVALGLSGLSILLSIYLLAT
jgi:ribonuclease D